MNYLFKNTYMIDTEASAKSKFSANKFKTDFKDNFESKVTCNKSLLPRFCSTEQHVLVLSCLCPAKHYVPEDTTNMIKFDIMHSSPLAKLISTTVD